jgi:hypothetical protein
MSTIILSQKEKEIIEGDSVIRYRIPSPIVILDSMYAVLGKDYDLAKFTSVNDLPITEQMRLADSLSKQSITRWDGVQDDEGNVIDYDKTYVEYLPFSVKAKIFGDAMSFLAQNLTVSKSQVKKK